ncbi:Pentatricopeptide repeat [Melia azedarach]|uniref:Pentatricopeptide repeat n=1 Tax=Melia azedarach TaxID=155640 RepID=A0ACC1YWN3_MELAZ|nr:Pentatricopeptide repeat [Melia azedarach]
MPFTKQKLSLSAIKQVITETAHHPQLLSHPSRTTSTFLSIPIPESSADQIHKTIHCVTNTHRHPSSKLFFSPLNISYADLFSPLKSPPHLFEAKRLHALLLVCGFFNYTSSDRQLGSQLVSVYVNFGCLQEALLVFDKLPNKSNNVAWNSILRGFINVGEFSKVLEFYHSMLRQGLVPDNFTYPLVLKACSGLNDLEQGRIIRDQCGSLNEARQVFDEMPERDLASWGAMIYGALQSGEWFDALCFFRRMRFEGLRPDSMILAAFLPACGRLENKQLGMLFQGCAIRSGFESDLFISNALIDMYCKCGDMDEAQRIFCEMVYKDVVSWSTLIAGCSQNSLYLKSFELYLKMNKAGIRTNPVIAAVVLPVLGKLKLLELGKEMHNYILKQAFESDVFIGSTLIDMYANCGSMTQAEHVFEFMLHSGITIWNSIIAGYSLNDDLDSAFGIFRRMRDFNLKPNSITLVSILPMCTKIGSVRLGKEIHGYATKTGLGKVISVGNSTIDMYCKCGYLKLGVMIFNQMTEKNIVTYNTIISAHGIHGHGQEAFTFFEQMKKAGIRPNKVTFVALLSASSHSGMVERGWFFYNSMINDYCIPPEMEHYSCMVDLLGRAGQLHDACNFIRRLPVEPEIDVLGSLLGACKVHNKVELAHLVGEHILQKNQKDPGHYVLLSNIYAYTHRWNDALKIRTMIKEKALVKKPGSSWIQVGSCIHSFHARGKMHPDFHKIQETLESLLLEMKDEGYMLDSSLFPHDPIDDADEVINFLC